MPLVIDINRNLNEVSIPLTHRPIITSSWSPSTLGYIKINVGGFFLAESHLMELGASSENIQATFYSTSAKKFQWSRPSLQRFWLSGKISL